MTGQLIGMIILWLIIAVIVIAVVVWLLNWLYHRSTKDMSFVRTGLGGEKVVINGGARVLPIIHEVTPVTMSVHRLRVTREKEQALITRDRMRVDIDADFYVRVRPTTEGVSMAASTLGRRMMQEDGLNELLEGKFVSVLRAVAAEMSLDEMHERRAAFIDVVAERSVALLDRNGLELESAAITDLDQTELEYFNPANRFDAEGLTTLITTIEERRRIRNDIEQTAMLDIRARNLQAEQDTLDIERRATSARLKQEREIEELRAEQRAEVVRVQSEREAQATAARITSEQETTAREIARRRANEQAEIAAREEVEQQRIAHERTLELARLERETAVRAREIAERAGVEAAQVASDQDLRAKRIAADEATSAREIARRRALEEAEIAANEELEARRIEQERKLELARIDRTRTVRESEIAERSAVESAEVEAEQDLRAKRIAAEEATEARDIARQKVVESAGIDSRKVIDTARIAQEMAIEKARIEREKAVKSMRIGEQQATAEAEIASREEIERARIASDRALEEARILFDRDTRRLEIERAKVLELAEIEKAMDILRARSDESAQRAATAEAEARAAVAAEAVETGRETEIAKRIAAVDRMMAEKDADTARIAAETDKIRAAVHAEAERLMNEADNMLTDDARAGRLRGKMLERLEGIIRESVRPLESIEGIKIVHMGGLAPGGSGPAAPRSPTDEVIDSALRFRARAPLIDEMMKEIGVPNAGVAKMGDIFRSAKDAASLAKTNKSDDDSMAEVYVSTVIPAPPDRVWRLVRDFNALPDWHPLIATSRIEEGRPADQVGCIRAFQLTDGGRIREQLLALSDYDFSCTYAILESPMGVSDYIATLKLTPITETGQTFAEWSADFACAPAREAELVQSIGQGVFAAGLAALGQRLARAA